MMQKVTVLDSFFPWCGDMHPHDFHKLCWLLFSFFSWLWLCVHVCLTVLIMKGPAIELEPVKDMVWGVADSWLKIKLLCIPVAFEWQLLASQYFDFWIWWLAYALDSAICSGLIDFAETLEWACGTGLGPARMACFTGWWPQSFLMPRYCLKIFIFFSVPKSRAAS